MKLKTRFLAFCINWIGNHILSNGYKLEIRRVSDEELHADISKMEERR